MYPSHEKSPSSFMKAVGKVGDLIENLLLLIGSICIVVFFLAVVLDVAARTANNSLLWTQDTAIFAYVWCIFTASAVCIRRNEHFSIELLSHFPPAVRKVQQILILIILFAFSFYMVRYGWEYSILGLNRSSSSSGFQLFYAIICIPVSSAASIYFLVEQVLCLITGTNMAQVSKNIAKLQKEGPNS